MACRKIWPCSTISTAMSAPSARSRAIAPPAAPNAPIDERNAQMAALAGAIESTARAERDGAYDQLSRSSRNWQMLVILSGLVTIGFVLLILVDLLYNILPA